MGWLVGLPLGLFRLLGSILLVALRFAVPILILVAVILVVRHVRRRSARYRAEDEDRSRNFTALCIRWIMRRSRTPRTRRRTRATEWNSSTWRASPCWPC